MRHREETAKVNTQTITTFSIAARDPDSGDLGVAVQSRFFAVGSVVPWAEAEVGVIATQSRANTAYGPKGLALLENGLTAQETLDRLVAEDDGHAHRQVGIVDAHGSTANFTGAECIEWAGAYQGTHYTAQGNILASAEVVSAMGEVYEETIGDLPEKLLGALLSGQEQGGDRRGQQSAVLLVVRKNGGYGGFNDRYIDLRVDDHETPIVELQRLLDLWREVRRP